MRKCISVTDNRVLKKLETVENQSAYLQDLVIRDITNKNYNPVEFIDIIKELIEGREVKQEETLSEEGFMSIFNIE